MTRAALCGDRLRDAAAVLDLEVVDEGAEVALVDLEDPVAVAAASGIAATVPRIVLAGPQRTLVLRAAGCAAAVAASAEPAAIGPLVSAALPPRPRRATRLVVVTGTRGGTGRTMLVGGIAERMARRLAVLVVDATGSGEAGRRLGLAAGPWADLEGLVDELTTEHLAVVAAQRDTLRVLGGPPAMPSAPLLAAVGREAIGLADVVIVDAPPVHDERTAALRAAADRVLLVATADDRVDPWLDERTWPILTRSHADRIGAHSAMRSLPDDPSGRALARAYDDLAELLTVDAT